MTHNFTNSQRGLTTRGERRAALRQAAPPTRAGPPQTVFTIAPPQPPPSSCSTPAIYNRYLSIYTRYLDMVPFSVQEPSIEAPVDPVLPKLGRSTPWRGSRIKSLTCAGCKQTFESSNAIHKHIRANPEHKKTLRKRVIYRNDHPDPELKDQIKGLPENEELRANMTGEFDGDIFEALRTFGIGEIKPFGDLPGPTFTTANTNATVMPLEDDITAPHNQIIARSRGVFDLESRKRKALKNRKIQELEESDELDTDEVTKIFETFPRSANIDGDSTSVTYSQFLKLSSKKKEEFLAGLPLTNADFHPTQTSTHIISEASSSTPYIPKGTHKDPDLLRQERESNELAARFRNIRVMETNIGPDGEPFSCAVPGSQLHKIQQSYLREEQQQQDYFRTLLNKYENEEPPPRSTEYGEESTFSICFDVLEN